MPTLDDLRALLVERPDDLGLRDGYLDLAREQRAHPPEWLAAAAGPMRHATLGFWLEGTGTHPPHLAPVLALVHPVRPLAANRWVFHLGKMDPPACELCGLPGGFQWRLDFRDRHAGPTRWLCDPCVRAGIGFPVCPFRYAWVGAKLDTQYMPLWLARIEAVFGRPGIQATDGRGLFEHGRFTRSSRFFQWLHSGEPGYHQPKTV
jgi:hypothetical protein